MLRPNLHVGAIKRWLHAISGCETRLRLVQPEDAEFILHLRTDPVRGANLSATPNSAAIQRAWLAKYEIRFSAGKEAYFIVENKGAACGTVRLYDYRPEHDSFSWGSWIVEAGTSPSVAIRAALLIYDLAFGPLGFSSAHFDVRQANCSVWRFHEKMGASLLSGNEQDRFYAYTVNEYLRRRAELERHTQGRPWVEGIPRICIAGKHDIAADCLIGLLDRGYAPEELCVVANRNDDGRHAWQKSLLATARQNGVRVWPISAVQQLQDIRFFSLEHDRILRPSAFRSPHLYNLHFSRLPAYRGVATSVWPIRNRENSSGVTLHRIDEGIDTGRVIAQRVFPLSRSTKSSELYAEYMLQGRQLFFEQLDVLMASAPEGIPQEGGASYYPRSSIDYSDLSVDFSRPSAEVVSSIKSRLFWQYQLPAFEGRRIWDVSEIETHEILMPGQRRAIDGWSDLVGVGGGTIRLDYSFMDALVTWAKDDQRPASFPSLIPDLQTENAQGWTPLMIASYNGHLEPLRWLIESGANPDHQNRRGTTALMYAKSFAQMTGNLGPIKILLAAGARPDLKDQYGYAVSDYCDSVRDAEILSLIKA